jgi:hypothetical protein
MLKLPLALSIAAAILTNIACQPRIDPQTLQPSLNDQPLTFS